MILFTRKVFSLSASLLLFVLAKAQDAPLNQLSLSDQPSAIPFIWNADSINGKWDEHAALLIPVKLDNCPRQFYMQFDLGSPYSLFYTNKLAAIAQRYKRVITVADTTSRLTGFSFNLAGLKVKAAEIVLRAAGTDGISRDEKQIEIIGTIGTDLIDQREVMIDYPRKTIMLNDHPKDSLQTADLYYARRSVLFPAIVAGKKTILYFDTGSSAFELLTNKATAESLASVDAIPVNYKVNSWGKMLEATTLPVSGVVEIGGADLPLKYATYIEGASDSQVQQMMKMGIGGMTGNKLFLQSVLFMDLKKKKFAVLPGNEQQ